MAPQHDVSGPKRRKRKEVSEDNQPPPRNKKKKSREEFQDDSEAVEQDEEEDAIDILSYVTVILPVSAQPAVVRTRKTKSQAAETTMAEHGPFKTKSTMTFNQYLDALADTLQCRKSHLPVPQLRWKLTKPQNDVEKPMTTDVGYEAMITAMKERRGGHMVRLVLPKPGKQAGALVSAYIAYISRLSTDFRVTTAMGNS